MIDMIGPDIANTDARRRANLVNSACPCEMKFHQHEADIEPVPNGALFASMAQIANACGENLRTTFAMFIFKSKGVDPASQGRRPRTLVSEDNGIGRCQEDQAKFQTPRRCATKTAGVRVHNAIVTVKLRRQLFPVADCTYRADARRRVSIEGNAVRQIFGRGPRSRRQPGMRRRSVSASGISGQPTARLSRSHRPPPERKLSSCTGIPWTVQIRARRHLGSSEHGANPIIGQLVRRVALAGELPVSTRMTPRLSAIQEAIELPKAIAGHGWTPEHGRPPLTKAGSDEVRSAI